MQKAQVNGVRLVYQQFGCGSEMVMIHGLATNRAFWYLPIAQQLESNFHITLYDLRGHGYSDIPQSGYTSADMAQDLHELLDHLQIQRATLVGHSFGGVVALHYALQHPERVNQLVIADSRIYALQPFQRLEDTAYRSALEETFLAKSGIDWQSEVHLGLRFLEEMAKECQQPAPPKLHDGFIPFGESRGNSKTAKKWLHLLEQTTARHDLVDIAGLTVEKIRQLSCRTLAIYGERSRCLPSYQALKNFLPDCQTVLVPEAGHFHPMTKPEFFINTLTSFLNPYSGQFC